jgi:hypothetical protein
MVVEKPVKTTGKKTLLKLVMLGLIGLILVFSLVQTYTISKIEGTITGQSTGVSLASSSSSSGAPSTVQASAPTMVGGC